jgi:hypothetical protein
MANGNLLSSTILSGALVVGLFGGMAIAADVDYAKLPAVSAFNGKVELGGGFADFDTLSSDELFYGGASISVPLGDMFGLQADLAVVDVFGETGVGGNVHLFTRDPASYLLGVIGGYGDAGTADAFWLGGEAEFYMDNFSIEAAAGYMNLDPSVGSNSDELFAFLDLGYYATENFRLTLGGSSVAGFESANIGAEYMMADMPLSFKVRGEVGEDDFVSATAGITFYFGGNEANKSLIRRHREDDPRNRAIDIFGKGAAAFGNGGAPAVCVVPALGKFAAAKLAVADPECPPPPFDPET